jgi:uncharacterized protein (DUF885 family)
MKIYNKFFNEYLDINPELGSFIGYRKYDEFYSISISKEYRNKYYSLCENYLNKLQKDKNIDKNDIYIKSFKYFLEIELDGKKFENYYLIPLGPNDNYILNFIELLLGESYLPLKTIKSYENMINQLRGFKEWIDIAMENMKIGIEKKYIISKLQCKKLIEQLNSIIRKKSYMPTIKDIPSSIKDKYLDAIEICFVKGVKNMNHFIKKEYLDNCLKEGGLSNLPDGKKYYQHLINYYTTLNNYTPEKIHKLGLSEVKHVTEELNIIKNKLGYDCSLKEFKKLMQNDPKNYYKSSDDIMTAFKKMRTSINKNIMPKYFNLKINHDYEIESIPSYLSDYSTSAYYQMASYDDSRKGTFYLDTSNLKGNPIYETKVLSLHEGNPGHHFQLTYSIDKKIPKFFLYIMDATAYVEGWGLYCESFINKDDYLNEYGRLNFEMMRSVRLVIDTGIHYYGWSYEKAFKYYDEHCLSTKKETQNEILRYIESPGQALAYKIGEIFINNLRDEYLKKNNNIKAFHKNFLQYGALPLCFM